MTSVVSTQKSQTSLISGPSSALYPLTFAVCFGLFIAAKYGGTGTGTEYRNSNASFSGRMTGIKSDFLISWNPFNLSINTWLTVFAVKCVAIAIWDTLTFFIAAKVFGEVLGSRKVRSEAVLTKFQLEWIDYLYIGINSFVEYVYLSNLVYFCWTSTHIKWSVDELSALNTFFAVAVFFLLDDTVYALAHRFMHWKPVYPWVHKHHHRQCYPTRGYIDAGNEHPIENALGLSILCGSIVVVAHTFDMHAFAVLFAFVFVAFFNVVNHTEYDISFKFLGLYEYSVKAHEMHHRYFTCNYAKSFMYPDVLMGTYREYHE